MRPDSCVSRVTLAVQVMASLASSELSTAASVSDPPRLILQITVDGLRADLPHRYARHFGEGGSSRPIRHVSTGRGGRAAPAVPGYPGSDTPVRRAVAEGSADMTSASRSPTQQRTRGLRCQSVPTPAQAARRGLQNALPCQDSASRPRPRTQAHHRALELEGGCYAGARMARRWSRAKVIWEMSASSSDPRRS